MRPSFGPSPIDKIAIWSLANNLPNMYLYHIKANPNRSDKFDFRFAKFKWILRLDRKRKRRMSKIKGLFAFR